VTTTAEHDADLAEQIRAIVARHYPGLLAAGLLVRELTAFTSSQRAEAIETHAHSPASQRGPGRQQEQEARSA
jgi:hypothetical protein